MVVQAGRANMAAIARMELRKTMSPFLIGRGVMPLGSGESKQAVANMSALA
ncbi:hypothetical protein SKA58_12130 [Sphingomonas sp. SKA58]|nr:hypothetical protein SKA58_12130 [Sphingomonas sp. SKA58]